MLGRLNVPTTLKEYSTRWSHDDRHLLYISTVGNAANIWSLPLDGKAPKPITNFESQLIENFSLSPDGKRLAVSRMSNTSDAVLITDLR